jgi:hypothetical protein
MSFTRDLIQGFIDGYVTAGGDPNALSDSVTQYIQNHPLYQANETELASIQSDLTSYRVTPQDELAPSPVKMAPVPVEPLPPQ